MDATVCVPLGADLTTGATVCPRAGIAAAAANVNNKGKSRRCSFMACSRSWLAYLFGSSIVILKRSIAHEYCVCLEGEVLSNEQSERRQRDNIGRCLIGKPIALSSLLEQRSHAPP